MITPHPIPYQGSKRNIANFILEYFPKEPTRLLEPFAGAAAVSLLAAQKGKATEIVLNDINKPLMDLWESIIEHPTAVASAYKRIWNLQVGRERSYYDLIRDRFNRTQKPQYLLYLLARCVKASIRYNAQGKFNQSPDNRRRGMNPETMRWHIVAASRLLKGKTRVTAHDYREALVEARSQDIVYMDPPYQGVCINRDPRYVRLLDFGEFTRSLHELNRRGISYVVSYDGRTGEKSYGQPMPDNLELIHIEIDAGRSSQATLLGRDHNTYESIYLSPALVERTHPVIKKQLTLAPKQFSLLAQNA